MVYYILPFLIWSIFCTWKALRADKEIGFLGYIFALPLIFLAVLRGNVGTDTLTILQMRKVLFGGTGQMLRLTGIRIRAPCAVDSYVYEQSSGSCSPCKSAGCNSVFHDAAYVGAWPVRHITRVDSLLSISLLQ